MPAPAFLKKARVQVLWVSRTGLEKHKSCCLIQIFGLRPILGLSELCYEYYSIYIFSNAGNTEGT